MKSPGGESCWADSCQRLPDLYSYSRFQLVVDGSGRAHGECGTLRFFGAWLETRVQGRGQLPLHFRDRAPGGGRETDTQPFDGTAGIQVYRSCVGGLADGRIESQVAP